MKLFLIPRQSLVKLLKLYAKFIEIPQCARQTA